MSNPLQMRGPEDQYRFLSPDGSVLILTKELFDGLEEMFRRKCTGSVIVDFNAGRVAGVETQTKKVYK